MPLKIQIFAFYCGVTLTPFALSGCIPALVAGAAGGATIAAQDRPISEAAEDYALWTKIHHYYLQSGRAGLATGVNVEVVEGRVHLTGKVPTPNARIDAAKLAWQAEGVTSLTNDIIVNDTSSLVDYAEDKWIFTQMKSRLLLEKYVRSINYSIEVVNSVVYVMGIAQSHEEISRVARVARSIRGVRDVVIYARVK